MIRQFAAGIKTGISTPDRKRSYNEGLFTRVATEYDQATRIMSLGQDGAWKKRLVSLLPDIADATCVDLACGTGDVSLLLARKYPGGSVTGVDLTSAMLDVARQRTTTQNVRFLQADMCHTGLPTGFADIVTGSYAVRNAPVLADAITEIARLLRPGGVAALLDFRKSASQRIAQFQQQVLRYWCGLSGYLVHGAPEHSYIAESLQQFPDAPTFRTMLESFGFEILSEQAMMMGMTQLTLLRKR